MASQATLNLIQYAYIAYYGRPADPVGQAYWANKLETQPGGLTALINAFGTSAEAVSLFGGMAPAQAVNTLYLQMFGREADVGGLTFYVNGLQAGTFTLASIALNIFYGATGGDVGILAAKLAAANAFTAELDTTNEILGYSGDGAAAAARAFLSPVVNTATSNAAIANADDAVANIVNGTGSVFTLTSSMDVATANIFNAYPVYTPGGNDLVNSLQDEDILTGTGTNPTLNVTLGSVNDNAESEVAPILTNIQTVNVNVTGDSGGINFQDASGLTALHLSRLTQDNGEAWFTDLDSTVTTLSVNNATRGGEVHFHYQEEVLTATNDTLNLGISSARVADLHLTADDDGGADQGYFFETLNVATTGNNDIDLFRIQANGREDLLNNLASGTTRQVLNIVANGTPSTGSLEINMLTGDSEDDRSSGLDEISIVANARVDIAADKLAALDESNDGIETPDLETLTITGAANVMIDGLDTDKQASGITLTVNAGTMTGNLKLGVASASDNQSSTEYAYRADKDLSVTSGSGNDEIRTYGVLAGDISTGEGNDIVAIRNTSNTANADVEGVSTINAGNGNNTVSANDLLVTASDADQVANTGYDDVTAARIITGTGIDSVTVRDLASGQDWDNKSLIDGNADDLYQLIGASIVTGAGADTVTLRRVAEGASVDTGADNDTLNVSINPLVANQTSFSPSTHTVLAADTDPDQQTVRTTSNTGTREVTSAEVADRLGAVVDMGAGTADVANFTETSSLGANAVTIVGRDAELRGAETVNVTALDRITVTTTTSMADQDALTTGVQTDINANVIGTQILNLTIANQIDARTAQDTGAVQNDTYIFNNNAVITADVMRFDSALNAINLVSQEQTMLLNPATEVYEAGTTTIFTLDNLRTGVALSLQANEATGVVGALDGHEGADVRRGALQDDSQLVINTTTGVVNAAVANTNQGAAAADVILNLNYDNARGLNDSAMLNVAAASGAFDLDLNIGATLTDTAATNDAGNNGNAASASDDDAMRIENFTVKFADANSHSIDANGFGDVPFRATRGPVVVDDISSTAATSFNVWSAAGAGKTIAIDAVNADTIRVMNADGTAVTAANVTLRVDAGNNYNVTTGAGTDVFDFRADNVRSDDIATAVDRADHLNAGTGRDTLIVNGSDSLGVNDNIESGVASTIIDDDVFATLRGIEKILVDGDFNAGGAETLDITLDEQAAITGVDTIALIGTQQQALNLVVGNNFVLQTVPVDNTNGQLTTAASALVVDASQHTGQTLLSIESKDDDTDIQLINLDVRVNAKGGTVFNLVNSGDVAAQTELRVYTADENDGHTFSSGNAGNTDGLVDINVTTGSFDKLVVLEGATANDNSGAEGAMTIAIDTAWTGTAFTVDASAVLDTDASVATGGATITAANGDTATLTIQGTQNSDIIVGGRGADVINGNAGNDTITGDEVTNQNELEVVTFAATYDAGDVITVTHNGNAMTATITADGVTGAAVAAAMAAYDLAGSDGFADNITTAGAQFAAATSAEDAGTRQLRLTGAVAGTDYVVTATTNNAGDNVAQVQTLSITDDVTTAGYDVQVVWNGVTYDFNETGADGTLPGVGGVAALNAAVTAAGGQGAVLAANVLTITGNASGANLPLITQVNFADVLDTGALAVVSGDLGTDQADPAVVTETLARTVVGAADIINGGAGDDIIAGLTGADVLDGGDGNDTLDYSLSLGGVTVNLATNTASGGDAAGDIISNFENIWGSAYNDVLTGSDVANILNGGAGNDIISGGAGADTITGGTGADTITGGTGGDSIDLGVDTVEDIVKFASGDGVDSITNFLAGTDTIQFTDFADRDLLPTSLLQQTAVAGGNAAISGNNTELLVVTNADLTGGITATNVAAVLDAAFNVSTLADGKVIFAIQADTGGVFGADSTVFGYYTDVGTDDTVVAGDIEIIGVLNNTLAGSADFWLAAV